MRRGARNINSSFARFNGRRIPSSRTQAMNATQAETAALPRAAARRVAGSETLAPTTQRAAARAIAAPTAGSPLQSRAMQRAISRSTTGAPALIAGRGYARTPTVTEAQAVVVTMTKIRASNPVVTLTASPLVRRAMTRGLLVTAASTPIRVQSLSIARALGVNQSASEKEAASHVLVLSEVETATLTSRRTLNRTLAVSNAEAAAMNRLRGYGRLMTVSESMSTLIERLATGHPAPAVIQIYDIGPAYSRATLIGATTVMPPDQKMLDILAMLTVNTPIYVCDNALKLALDQAPELSRVI